MGHRMPRGKPMLLSRRYGAPSYAMHRCCALLLKFESLLCIVAEVGHFASETDTWRRAPDGRDLEPLDPLLEAAGSPSFAAFSASGPAIADGSEALEIELRLWWQKMERERAQSGQRATVAQSTTPSVDEAEQMADDGQYKFMLAWRLRKRMCVAARAVILPERSETEHVRNARNERRKSAPVQSGLSCGP